MTRKPGVGKTRHRWLLGDLDTLLAGSQDGINQLIAEIRRIQERPGRPQFQDLAMLVAELAQVLAKARAISREMQSLIEQAPDDIGAGDIDADDTARLYESVSDLQRQIDEINERSAI